MTQEGRLTWRMDAKLSAKRGSVGKSMEPLTLKRDWYINSSEEMYSVEPTLTRKASSKLLSDRTANRHR